jgi:hypothetical protein
MPKLTVSLTESQAERLAWLTKNLDMAGGDTLLTYTLSAYRIASRT